MDNTAEAAWRKAYLESRDRETDALISILKTIKDWDIDSVNSLIWRLAEARSIVILQTVTAEHVGADEPLDARRIHRILSHHPIVESEGVEAVREALSPE